MKTRILFRLFSTITMLISLLCVPIISNAKPHTKSYAPLLGRAIVPVKSSHHGPQLATWYGPGLFGNRTACGQTLRQDTWGIAHRTLRCGTLVTITNGKRSVTVPVIDRGPFSGATVDLTSRTKQYLGFRSGRVKMATVNKFRYATPKSKTQKRLRGATRNATNRASQKR